jgi:hypothetical protein
MAITSTGKNLSVLVCSDYNFIFNWMSFAAWYSISKNLPDAKVAVVSSRNNINLQLYRWVNKIDAKFFLHTNVGKANNLPYLNKLYSVYVALKEGLVEQPCLVLDADMMALRGLTPPVLDKLNSCDFATNQSKLMPPVGPMWYFNNQSLETIIGVINSLNSLRKTVDEQGMRHLDLLALHKACGDPVVIEDLCNEVHEPNATVFTHYPQKCGNFFRKEYEKGLAYPPFTDQLTLRTIDMTVNERKVFSLWAQMHMTFEALSK